MKKKPQIFISLDDELISQMIGKAERTIIYAGPAISCEIAEAIVKKTQEKPDSMVRVIVNADAESLRLGYGKFGGIKMLWNYQVDVRCSPGLRIGALVVDNRSWIFSPTPEIILDKPSKGTLNAITVNPSFTKWLIFSMAPKEGFVEMARELIEVGTEMDESKQDSDGGQPPNDEVLNEQLLNQNEALNSTTLSESAFEEIDLIPQIGTDAMTSDRLAEIEHEIEERPPRQFDQAREILVYNGYLQFVDMKFSGGRLSARTIRLPEQLLNIVDSLDERLEIRATFKIFDDVDKLCPVMKEFEQRVNDVRRCYTQPLGGELGSVILARNKADFEKEIQDLRDELDELCSMAERQIKAAINESSDRIIEILTPILLANPPEYLLECFEHSWCSPTDCTKDYLRVRLGSIFPTASELIENVDLRCAFKDVTWEMLNDNEFGNAIKKKFPNEAFTELYGKRNAIGEKKSDQMRRFTDDDWPDQIDNEPTGF